DHSTSASNSNESSAGITARPLDNSAPFVVAEVKAGRDASGAEDLALIGEVARKLLPGTAGIAPNGTRVVAFGVGPRNTAIGKTMAQSPIYPGCDGKYYGRYVAIFQCYA